MIEKRRHPRKRPEVALQVTDAMSAEPIGRLGNLSADGLMLIAHAPIAEDALYQFAFSLPDAHGRLHPVEIGVHELWSEPARLAGQTWVGFHFVDIGGDDETVLRGWLESRAADAAGGFKP